MRTVSRARRYVLPGAVAEALADIFAVDMRAIEAVTVIEHSRLVRWHGPHVVATTRRGTIHVRDGGARLARDLDLLLHEYFHVLRQWNTGELTAGRYVRELLARGYARNRYEMAARAFARHNVARLCALLNERAAPR